MMKTRAIRKAEVVNNWYHIDATDVRLGRLATKIADLLMGKSKVNASENLNSGDYVIVTNCADLSVFPRRLSRKKYYRHSGYMGSLKEETLGELLERKPEEVIKKAVIGMLPNNKMRDVMLKRLFIYEGTDHKHEAQQPIKINVK